MLDELNNESDDSLKDKELLEYIKQSQDELNIDKIEVNRFCNFLKKKIQSQDSNENNTIFSDIITSFSAMLVNEPFNLSIQEISDLTDWQIIFLYMLPFIKKVIRENREMKKMKRK